MKHEFKKSIERGQQGERAFRHHAGSMLVDGGGRVVDFLLTWTGEGVELKTDYYDPAKSLYFFFERFSDVAREKPGGPWQALENGAVYFVYLFAKSGQYYLFRTRELVTCLNVITQSSRSVFVKNQAWTTQGYLVEREALAPIYKELNLKENEWKRKK